MLVVRFAVKSNSELCRTVTWLSHRMSSELPTGVSFGRILAQTLWILYSIFGTESCIPTLENACTLTTRDQKSPISPESRAAPAIGKP